MRLSTWTIDIEDVSIEYILIEIFDSINFELTNIYIHIYWVRWSLLLEFK